MPVITVHSQHVQHSLHSTLCVKGIAGQDTSAEGVPATCPSLKISLGCDTFQKDVSGHRSSVHRVLDSTLYDEGAVAPDTCV